MPAVGMAYCPVAVFREIRDRRVLLTLAVLTAEIVLERILARAQQSQLVPTSLAREGAQCGQVGCRHDRQVNILRKVVGHSVVSIDPGSTHRTRFSILLSV